jgi:hypothetical protein
MAGQEGSSGSTLPVKDRRPDRDAALALDGSSLRAPVAARLPSPASRRVPAAGRCTAWPRPSIGSPPNNSNLSVKVFCSGGRSAPYRRCWQKPRVIVTSQSVEPNERLSATTRALVYAGFHIRLLQSSSPNCNTSAVVLRNHAVAMVLNSGVLQRAISAARRFFRPGLTVSTPLIVVLSQSDMCGTTELS